MGAKKGGSGARRASAKARAVADASANTGAGAEIELPRVSERQFKSHGLTNNQRRAVTYTSSKLFSHRLCHRPPYLKLLRVTMFETPKEGDSLRPEAAIWSSTACAAFTEPLPAGATTWDKIRKARPTPPQ